MTQTQGRANPFTAEQLAKDEARAFRRNRPTASTIIMAAVAGDMLAREGRTLGKRGTGVCDCGRRISATRSQCRKCAGV